MWIFVDVDFGASWILADVNFGRYGFWCELGFVLSGLDSGINWILVGDLQGVFTRISLLLQAWVYCVEKL